VNSSELNRILRQTGFDTDSITQRNSGYVKRVDCIYVCCSLGRCARCCLGLLLDLSPKCVLFPRLPRSDKTSTTTTTGSASSSASPPLLMDVHSGISTTSDSQNANFRR